MRSILRGPDAFRFVDHGEGACSSPDEIGSARFVEHDGTTEPDLALRPLSIGNLQVRG